MKKKHTITINPDSVIRKGDEEKIANFLKDDKYPTIDRLVISAAISDGYVFAEDIIYSDKPNELPTIELILIKHIPVVWK